MLPFTAAHSNVVSLFPGVVYVLSDLSKKFSIHSSSSSLNSSFFFWFVMYSYTQIEFFGKSSNHLGLFQSSFSLANTKDVVGVFSDVYVAVQTCNCSDIFFLKRYSLTRAASFFLNTSYFFGSRYFLLSLSVSVLRHPWPYTNHPSFGDRVYSNLCFFCHFQ